MKRKNLEKTIVLGLLWGSSVCGTAWADYTISDDGNSITFDTGVKTVGSSVSKDSYDGNKPLNDFKNIIITATDEHGLDLQTNRVDFSNSDITVTVNSTKKNQDGARLYNNVPNFIVNNFTAYVHSNIGDALNIDRGATANSYDGAPYAWIKGNLYAEVYDGHGIRANSNTYSKTTAYTNKITVDGTTTIKIYSDSHSSLPNPTAVFAGNDYFYNRGKGEILLKGATNINLEGEGNRGIWAGKNGFITVNSIDIQANKNSSYGIVADNGNISDWFFETGSNNFGSSVTLNGNNNQIIMNGEDSKAIYVEGVDGNGNSNSVKSGENGIGNLTAVGDIVADNSGKIDLEIRDWANITGDIEATNSAIIDLSIKENASDISVMSNTPKAINITGNVQAANGATIDLSLGDGATFTGRVDDYKDADNDELWGSISHGSLFDSDFVKENKVDSSGSVNLTLGNGSKWDVTEQSWVTKIDAEDSIIDLTKDDDKNHAVHIGDLNGNATFVVNLDPNTDSAVNNGNMIYVYDGTGAKDLNLKIANETEVLSGLQNGEKLRFATVASAGHGFGDEYIVRDRGIINSGFRIEYENYNENATEENNKYNGGEFSENKPGNDYVTDIYKDGENVYVIRDTSKDEGISDPGKTVVNMSKVNYSNAVYMDRLNKRLGEARYINAEEDQGMWVRMRHDRIGKDNEFRIMNTMYELGYDEKQECDNGERRVGAAIDYMDGSSEYTGVGGSGDVSRKGIWLYDTWLGDKGHYSDFVAKWGHLSNDFTLYRGGDKITGDFSNNVYSISAEYGRKKDIGNNWYFEPQVQLQYARVTDANYTTSQGTEVSLDAINSLIARAGFKLGKDLGERSTVYFKADLLHEFLGDQDIYAHDKTGTMDVTYGNEGTWCDIGFGFATAMSKTSYAYLDVETSLGNDYEETYQINAGLQWSF